MEKDIKQDVDLENNDELDEDVSSSEYEDEDASYDEDQNDDSQEDSSDDDEDQSDEEKDWKAEALKQRKETLKYKAIAERKAKQAEDKAETKKKPQKKAQSDTSDDDQALRIERLEFKVNHPNIPGDSLDFIESQAKAKGVSFEEAYEDRFVKSAVQSVMRKERTQNASIDGSGSSSPRKSFNDKVAQAIEKGDFKEKLPELIKEYKRQQRRGGSAE